ncbi:MAG TPA: division/cell wall cluster transcriptional repressor MraZ [Bacilli bacterium]|nr:division/cell wall cluster transcriptional repressor MraZ [Bacilli bacterium]
MFMGEYHHTLDEKGRITIPSKIRYDLGEEFIMTRGLDNCLFIYPKEAWNNIISKYKDLPNTKDARNFMRFFLSGAITCTFDKQGRINIPIPLTAYAGLIKECIIIGVDDRLEVWSKDAWEKFLDLNEANMTEIADNLFAPKFNS